jgi:hypothetical protein
MWIHRFWRTNGTGWARRDGHGNPGLRHRRSGAEGHAPVVAVLGAGQQKRQKSPLLPPKGTDPVLCGISPAKARLFGDHDGHHDGDRRTPLAGTPPRLAPP